MTIRLLAAVGLAFFVPQTSGTIPPGGAPGGNCNDSWVINLPANGATIDRDDDVNCGGHSPDKNQTYSVKIVDSYDHSGSSSGTSDGVCNWDNVVSRSDGKRWSDGAATLTLYAGGVKKATRSFSFD